PLARILEARGLQAIGVHERTLVRRGVEDDQGKVVAWLEEEQHRVKPLGRRGRRGSTVQRIVLRGVRGYDAEFERLARLLEGATELAPAASESFDPRTRLAPARRPGRWPVLTIDVSAASGLARIARAQLEVLRVNRAGMRAGLDAEYLHDSRIALRRLRSLLGQLDGVLVAGEQEALVDGLRWIAGCTGAVRDLDTLLLELRLTEPELRERLAPVLEALEEERTRRQAALVTEIDSARAVELLARLRATFSAKGVREKAGPRADKPFGRVLAKRLRRRLRQVFELAEIIGPASPPA